MTSLALEETRAAFDRAFRVQSAPDYELRRIRRHIAALKDEANDLYLEADEYQELHDIIDSHLDGKPRGHTRKQRKKQRRRVHRRNENGANARQARIERNLWLNEAVFLEESAQDMRRQLMELRKEIDFYPARHRYLKALAESRRDNEEACAAKLRLLEQAGIPDEYEPEDVWYYEHTTSDGDIRSHFFFGGGASPLGDGISPDGEGHGHYVLRTTMEGVWLEFAREPLPHA